MTPQEFKTIRQSRKMTQTQLGDFIGKSLRTIRDYEKGVRPIPLAVEKLLNLIKI